MTNTPKSEAAALAVVANLLKYADLIEDELVAGYPRKIGDAADCASPIMRNAAGIINRLEREISDLRIEIVAGDKVIDELHDEIAALKSAQPATNGAEGHPQSSP